MGVEVHRLVETLAQRTDESPCRLGAQEAGHVLDAQHVDPGGHQLFGDLEVVVEGVGRLERAGEIAGVAERSFRERSGFEHRLDRRPHLADVVQGVEDAKDVDASGCSLGDEALRDEGRIGRVADGVAPPQQHLQAEVRDLAPQLFEPLPGVFVQEAQGDVVGSAAPRFDRQQLWCEAREVRGDEVPDPRSACARVASSD